MLGTMPVIVLPLSMTRSAHLPSFSPRVAVDVLPDELGRHDVGGCNRDVMDHRGGVIGHHQTVGRIGCQGVAGDQRRCGEGGEKRLHGGTPRAAGGIGGGTRCRCLYRHRAADGSVRQIREACQGKPRLVVAPRAALYQPTDVLTRVCRVAPHEGQRVFALASGHEFGPLISLCRCAPASRSDASSLMRRDGLASFDRGWADRSGRSGRSESHNLAQDLHITCPR